MGFRHRFIIGANFSLVIAAFFFRQEIAGNANSAAGIGHINGLTLRIIRIDFHRMHFRGGRTANQQRNIQAAPLHFSLRHGTFHQGLA